MNLEELGYQFENVGQYRSMMKCLGYDEQYVNRYLQFTAPDGEVTTRSISDIRSAITEIPEAAYNNSLNYLTSFFDSAKAETDLENYNKYLEENYQVSIVKWTNIKEKEHQQNIELSDGFTVIDLKNKISYTGARLYKHSFENGFILDGKGTQTDNDLTELYKLTGNNKKISRDKRNNVTIQADSIEIPDSIYGKKLEVWQKDGLKQGEIVIVRNSKEKPIYLQIDQKNKIITVRTDKEIKMPNSIGGHELTDLEKTLLANDKFTPPIIIQDKGQYFQTQVRLTDDKFGIEFKNMIPISKERAKEIMDIKNTSEIFISNDGKAIEPDKQKEMELELLKGLYRNFDERNLTALIDNANKGIGTNMNNFYDKYELREIRQSLEEKKDLALGDETLNQFREKIKAHVHNIDPSIDLDMEVQIVEKENQEAKTTEVEAALSITQEMEKVEEINLDTEKTQVAEKEESTVIDKKHESENILTVQEEKIIAAIKDNDYVELNKIAQSGYVPSEVLKKEIEGMNLDENKKVGVIALLGFDKEESKKATKEKGKDIKSPVKSNVKDQTLRAVDGMFR